MLLPCGPASTDCRRALWGRAERGYHGGLVQFSVGIDARSMTSTSTGPRLASSFKPSCSCSADVSPGAAAASGAASAFRSGA